MTRFRALAAMLSCLAVLAGSFMTVAAAATEARAAVARSAVDVEPCSHCDDCQGMPCPKPAGTCLQAYASVTPAIAAAPVDLPAMDFRTFHWSPSGATLSGLSPPPDPFPPRT